MNKVLKIKLKKGVVLIPNKGATSVYTIESMTNAIKVDVSAGAPEQFKYVGDRLTESEAHRVCQYPRVEVAVS